MARADFRSTYACWRWNGARQKRPMNSIVLEPAVKEMLLADCRDFLRSEDWYVYYLQFIWNKKGTCGLVGMLKGVGSLNVVHVNARVLIILFR